MGEDFISRKSCKTYKNTVKSKIYALLQISRSHWSLGALDLMFDTADLE